MTGWLVLLFSLCALTLAQSEFEGETCEVFAIRREGVVFLRIDTIDTQKVVIPDEFVLTVDTLRTTEFIFNDQYIFSTVNDGETDQVVIRKRVVDETTGLWVIPRPLRSQLVEGRYALDAAGEKIDLATIGLWELREFLKERNGDNLALQGLTDPFADKIPFDHNGIVCHGTVSLACISVADELFETISATASAPAQEYFESLRSVDTLDLTAAGEEGYSGSVTQISVKESSQWMGSSLTNQRGYAPGQAGFRLADSEVEDVFWLEAKEKTKHEVAPGVSVSIYGWRGGQVMDFKLIDGRLVDGHIVVGPHPTTDPWDVVYYGAKNFGPEGNTLHSRAKRDHEVDSSPFSDLEVTSPGPALSFGFGRKVRVYVQNMIAGEGGIQFSWIGMKVPHDQDGASWPAVHSQGSHVFEFQVNTMGTKIYVDTHVSANTFTGLFGGVLASYPADLTQTWDRRYAHVFFDWAGLHTMNGESYPGTVRRLGGWFRDRVNIVSSYPAPDGSGDTIVQIADTPRAPVSEGYRHPKLRHECPAYGGPIVDRPGTGCISKEYGHVHKGHQISSRTFSPGTWVTISGHNDRSGHGVEYTINGHRLAVREGESHELLRIKKVGAGTNGGVGGELSIWRLHKADHFENPQWQNNGFGGSYMRFNYEEQVAISYINPGQGVYPIHLQGHQYKVFAVDGEILASPLTRHTFPLHEGSTFDILVSAKNPNHSDAWLHFARDPHAMHAPYEPVWINGASEPAGTISYFDYTGFAQDRLALDAYGWAHPFEVIPPACTAETWLEGNVAHRDILLWEADIDDSWIILDGTVDIPVDRYLERDIVEVKNYEWVVVEKPTGAANPIVENVGNFDARVRGLTAVGEYKLRFRVWGSNVESSDSGAFTVECDDEVTITVQSDILNELHRERTEYWGKPINARLPAESDGPDRGHITFQLYNAKLSVVPDTLDLSIEITSKNPPNISPLIALDSDFGGVTFYRWPVQNSVAHIWYGETQYTGEVTTPKDKRTVPYTLGRITLDSRITSYNNMAYARGGLLGAEIVVSKAVDGSTVLPNHVEVLLPLWQGVADVDGSSGLQATDPDVYFLITEASDPVFCEYYGCTYAPALHSVNSQSLAAASVTGGRPNALLQDATRPNSVRVRATTFLFNEVPSNIPTGGNGVDSYPVGYSHGEGFSEEASTNTYSPLKTFTWTPPVAGAVTRTVVANMPFVYWDANNNRAGAAGSFDVQNLWNPAASAAELAAANTAFDSRSKLPTYTGGCSDVYRSAHPSQWWFDYLAYSWDNTESDFDTGATPGPYISRGVSCSPTTKTLDIHTGGQLTRDVNFVNMMVAVKAHKAHFSSKTRFPFYILTDTSDVASAQTHGVNYAPRLGTNGAASHAFAGVSSLRVIANGYDADVGAGPSGFHPALLSVTPDVVEGYTPLTHVTNLFFNCGNYDLAFGDLISLDYQTLVFKDVINKDQTTPYWKKRNAFVGVDVDMIPPVWEDFDSFKISTWTPLFQTADIGTLTSVDSFVHSVDFGFPVFMTKGMTSTQADISLHGLLSFGGNVDGCVNSATCALTAADGDNCRCSGQLFPTVNDNPWADGAIAGWWGHYIKDQANAQNIRYKIIGDIGSRTVIIHWDDVAHYELDFSAATTAAANFQMRLHEATPNIVEVHYQVATHPKPDASRQPTDTQTRYYTAGAQGQDGDTYANFFYGNDDLTKKDPVMVAKILKVGNTVPYQNRLLSGARDWFVNNIGTITPVGTNIRPSLVAPTITSVTLSSTTADANSFTLSIIGANAAGGSTWTAANAGDALYHTMFYEVFPGYTPLFTPLATSTATTFNWKVTLVKQVAVRYTFPAEDLPAQNEGGSTDVAQLYANLNTAKCASYIAEKTSQTSTLWSNQVDSLIWSGSLIETEAPAGSWVRGPKTDLSLDHKPVIWNTPQLFSFDTSQYFDRENSLQVNNDAVWNQNYLSGTWAVVWNAGNLAPTVTNPIEDPVPVNTNTEVVLPVYLNPLAVVASLSVDVSTSNKDSYWWRDPISTSADPCPVCLNNGFCAPCWTTNFVTYPDLSDLAGARKTELKLTITPMAARPDAWFTVLESSDALFAQAVGAAYVPSLSQAAWTAVDSNVQFPRWFNELAPVPTGDFSKIDGKFTFSYVPGNVGNNQGRGPISNPWYSPLKRFTYNGRIVTINAPTVRWGTGEGQQMALGGATALPYTAPCSADIRRNHPSDIWLNNGPVGCNYTGIAAEARSPLEVHNGGQVLKIATAAPYYAGVPSVTVKLHKGSGHDPKHVPYYTIWDASDVSLAGTLGVPVTSSIRTLGKMGPSVQTVRTFANGRKNPSGGPYMFEQSLFPTYPDEFGYTAFSRLTSLFYNCNEQIAPSTSFYRYGANVAVGDKPVAGSGIAGFDPLQPEEYDPYQVRRDLKGLDCTDWTKTISPSDFHSWKEIDDFIASSWMFESETPAGVPQDSYLNLYTVANMPQHLYLNLRMPNDLRPVATSSNSYKFWAVDDALTWYFTVNDGPVTPVYQCRQNGIFNCVDEYNNPNTDAAVNKRTVTVKPGDRVEVWVLSSYTPHGLLWHLSNDTDVISGTEAFDLHNFFEVDAGYTATKQTTHPRFLPTSTHYYYGSANAVAGSQKLFGGVVRSTALGADEWAWAATDSPAAKRAEEAVPTGPVRNNRSWVWFTDSAFGPAAMRVRLLAYGKTTDNN